MNEWKERLRLSHPPSLADAIRNLEPARNTEAGHAGAHASERASAHADEHARSRAGERAGERASERAGERAGEHASEHASVRAGVLKLPAKPERVALNTYVSPELKLRIAKAQKKLGPGAIIALVDRGLHLALEEQGL